MIMPRHIWIIVATDHLMLLSLGSRSAIHTVVNPAHLSDNAGPPEVPGQAKQLASSPARSRRGCELSTVLRGCTDVHGGSGAHLSLAGATERAHGQEDC